MNEKRLQEIFTDETFVRSLFELDSAEDVRAALKEKGLELSLDEIKALNKQLAAQNGEMAAEDLNNVAGGLSAIVPGPITRSSYLPLPFSSTIRPDHWA